MLTDTRQALLNAIRDQPDDDAPRLIYADWLDENGDPERARFIRLQCELARLPWWDTRRSQLDALSYRTVKKHRKTWLKGLPKCVRGAPFTRGFLGTVTIKGAEGPTALPLLWEREPVATITLGGQPKEIIAMLQHPTMAHVRKLGIYHLYDQAEAIIRALLTSPYTATLHDLMLSTNPLPQRLGPETLALLHAWHWPGLRSLLFALWHGTPADIVMPIHEAVLTGSVLRSVTKLSYSCRMQPEFVAAFAHAPTHALQELNMNANGSGVRWLEALLPATNLGQLRSLTFANPDDLDALNLYPAFFASPLLAGLEQLFLPTSQWPHFLFEQLAASPNVQNLRRLFLIQSDMVDDRVASTLAASPYLRNLRVLGLMYTRITEAGRDLLRQAFPECQLVG